MLNKLLNVALQKKVHHLLLISPRSCCLIAGGGLLFCLFYYLFIFREKGNWKKGTSCEMSDVKQLAEEVA